jgi:hypothetical protein
MKQKPRVIPGKCFAVSQKLYSSADMNKIQVTIEIARFLRSFWQMFLFMKGVITLANQKIKIEITLIHMNSPFVWITLRSKKTVPSVPRA